MAQEDTKIGWLTKLEAGQRIVAVLLLAVVALSGVIIRLSLKNDKLYNDKEKQIIECEQRVGTTYRLVQLAIQVERTRSDSALRVCELEKQAILLQRIRSIEEKSTKIQNAIK